MTITLRKALLNKKKKIEQNGGISVSPHNVDLPRIQHNYKEKNLCSFTSKTLVYIKKNLQE